MGVEEGVSLDEMLSSLDNVLTIHHSHSRCFGVWLLHPRTDPTLHCCQAVGSHLPLLLLIDDGLT